MRGGLAGPIARPEPTSDACISTDAKGEGPFMQLLDEMVLRGVLRQRSAGRNPFMSTGFKAWMNRFPGSPPNALGVRNEALFLQYPLRPFRLLRGEARNRTLSVIMDSTLIRSNVVGAIKNCLQINDHRRITRQ